MTRRLTGFLLGGGLVAFGMALLGRAAEPATVIMKDGFVIQGNYAKESESISDGSGRPIKVAKADGFDIIQDGPKYVIFSTHAGRGGKIDKETKRDAGPEFTTKMKYRLNRTILPVREIRKQSEFNAQWIRDLETVTFDGGFQRITQQVTKLDAYSLTLDSPTDNITQAYHTFEEEPARIRRLLSTHPDLKDPAGPVDPEKRVRIASFLKDVAANDGTRRQVIWLQAARKELELAKKDAPGEWSKKVTEQFDALTDDIDKAETRMVVDELEAAVRCGRYETARKFLAGFAPKLSDAKDKTRLATVKAAVELAQPVYERTAALLRAVIERESGMLAIQTTAAVTGVAPALYAPRPKLTPTMETLLEAGTAVLTELHPDTTGRLELFHDLARQSEQRRAEGKGATEQSDALLAYAISGWLKGKNGADKSVEGATRSWGLRKLANGYLAGRTASSRKAVLDEYQKANPKPLPPDELGQIITLLPPTMPMDLADPTWKPLPAAQCDGVEGVVRLNTGPLPEVARGVDYCLRLPPEYHHGRNYPVLLALPAVSMPAEKLVARLAEQAERNGYIVVAPEWTNQFGNGQYDFSGKDHAVALGALRDVARRFQTDSDKVFLFGYAEGANFAVDLGLARPDVFAGLAGFGPSLPISVFVEYWRNNQKLPTFLVTGELAGTFPNLRKVYERWMPRGFPAMLTLYRGRQVQWYTAEVPRLFDWMNRKTRVRGSGSLRLNQFTVEPWQILREGDDRFYWVGVAPGGTRASNPLANGVPAQMGVPPQFAADIGRGGVVTITQAIGVKKFTIWLERDLIDWTKPLKILINNSPPLGYTPKIFQPDLHLMFEELYRTGDRKMLFLGKVEVSGPG